MLLFGLGVRFLALTAKISPSVAHERPAYLPMILDGVAKGMIFVKNLEISCDQNFKKNHFSMIEKKLKIELCSLKIK